MNSELRKEYLAALGLKPWTLRARDALPLAAEVPATAAVPPPAAVSPAAVVPLIAELSTGVTQAREAGLDWPQLRARVAACTRCSLSATRTQTVFGVGNLQAD